MDEPMTKQAEELERDLDEMSQLLYQSNRQFVPMRPWVFVRVLPKEMQAGSLVLPARANKTIHEGIVLATWNSKREFVKGEWQLAHSDLAAGDHVLFPHWAGLPIPGYTEDKYRIVKESMKNFEEGGIFATVEYDDNTPARKLAKLLMEPISVSLSNLNGEEATALAKKIEEKFLLVDLDKLGVTLSGR